MYCVNLGTCELLFTVVGVYIGLVIPSFACVFVPVYVYEKVHIPVHIYFFSLTPVFPGELRPPLMFQIVS